jgi:phosphoribosylformylglycinamidine synthase
MPKVTVYVTLKPTLLDAQGRTVETALHQLGYDEATGVRLGKIIEMQVPAAADAEGIRKRVAAMCDSLLANPVTEDYRIVVGEDGGAA